MTKLFKKDQEKLGLLHYEIQMFRCMYTRLKNGENLSQGFKNAVLESFLLHVRNLIDFFQGTAEEKKGYKKHCKDIIVSDFKDEEGEYLPIVKNWKITLEDKDKINKRLAHLSEDRLKEGKDWSKEINKFKSEIEKQIKTFLGEISNAYFPFIKDNQEITKENFGRCEEKVGEDIKDVGITETSSLVASEIKIHKGNKS